MDLQNIFYTIGITFMVIAIFILLTVLYLLWKIHSVVDEFKEHVMKKVINIIYSNKEKAAGIFLMGISTFLINKIRGIFRR